MIFSVIGARPHFVKASPFMEAMKTSRHQVFTIHSGQHYDPNMSDIFFRELGMPTPDVNLGIGSGTHAEQTAGVMLGVERLITEMQPEAIVVYGDTNTTLGATLAAAKLYVPIVHVEAGVRCGNYRMPEEINRSLIDKLSSFLACPSQLAVENLQKEGIRKGVHNCGDFMYDTFVKARALAKYRAFDPGRYGVSAGCYFLATLHREETTASVDILSRVLDTLDCLPSTVVLPMHPRTRARLTNAGISTERSGSLKILEPLGYIEMISLLSHAKLVLTDSGGLQKEAYWARVPCVTLMNETTWVETVDAGWNVLVGLDAVKICSAVAHFAEPIPEASAARSNIYGSEGAAARVIEALGWR